MSKTIRYLSLPDPVATSKLAIELARITSSGDTLLLEGEIGAGKTTFARAFIRAVVGSDIEVPSPTYTIVQTYETESFEIWHCDLYRLTNSDEAFELGIEDAFKEAVVLVEWPDRLGPLRTKDELTLSFRPDGIGRQIKLTGSEEWNDRIGNISV